MSSDSGAMNAEEVFAQVSSSVVSIEVVEANSNSAAFGSGVIVGNGEMVTLSMPITFTSEELAQ